MADSWGVGEARGDIVVTRGEDDGRQVQPGPRKWGRMCLSRPLSDGSPTT